MDVVNAEFLSQLNEANGRSVQVLLSQFLLVQEDRGTQLQVDMRMDSRVIHTRVERQRVKALMANFDRRAEKYQSDFEMFLNGQGKNHKLEFNDGNFPFRYCSGGVLPIVIIENKSFFCLFYRDIEPVGWNIANGGTDTRRELLDPVITLEREFCEEFLIVDPDNGIQYRFECEQEEFSKVVQARADWREKLQTRDGVSLKEHPLSVEWIWGPDSVSVRIDDKRNEVRGVFVNINALDFGIEVDRIAKISVTEEALICDGELFGSHRINRSVGLFEVASVGQALNSGSRRFEPDVIFHDAIRYNRTDLSHVVYEKFLPGQFAYRTAEDQEVHRCLTAASHEYNLCPVTRSILNRYFVLAEPAS